MTSQQERESRSGGRRELQRRTRVPRGVRSPRETQTQRTGTHEAECEKSFFTFSSRPDPPLGGFAAGGGADARRDRSTGLGCRRLVHACSGNGGPNVNERPSARHDAHVTARPDDVGEPDGAFEALFKSSTPPRDKFLSRLFGIFSEDVVRHWCACPEAPYGDLGRPTLSSRGEVGRGHTLDFTLKDRTYGRVYVAELKCELEYDSYRYLRLRLRERGQVEHHQGAAFTKFLTAAREPDSMLVRVGGVPTSINGSVLVWGATTPDGKRSVQSTYGFADVLSVEEMLADLRRWGSESWTNRVAELRGWANELFDGVR